MNFAVNELRSVVGNNKFLEKIEKVVRLINKIEKNIKLATYASRCIENEILMYLRRNSKHKMEVSIDEPLNVDWDGNELLLSDILGTDEDVIYQGQLSLQE